MPISIYPPTLQSTQPAFLATSTEYDVKYTLQKVTSAEEIKHVQIRVVEQRSNSSIVNTSKYPDNVIYKHVKLTEGSGPYTIKILSSDLRKAWTAGVCYKIQLRFGSTSFPDNLKDFSNWKKKQINNHNFSEWSTVMIIKAIAKPEIYIENTSVTKIEVITRKQTESSLTPLFVGGYTDNVSNEQLDKYKFDLYSENEEDLIESSDWVQATSNKNCSYRFKTILTNNSSYRVYFSIVTRNGYESSVYYDFKVIKTYLEEISNATLTADDESLYSKENGCIRLYLSSKERLSGCYVLTRTSEMSNYQVYEDLRYFNYFNEAFNNTLLYTDFTIESGIRYKYAFHYQNSQGLRSAPLYEVGQPARCVNFEYSYLYRNGVQLRLKFNQKLNSFKHTVLTSKQDTLADQFPH